MRRSREAGRNRMHNPGRDPVILDVVCRTMLTPHELNELPINESALALLSEDFARENYVLPVSCSLLKLHVVIPMELEQLEEQELLAKLSHQLAREVTFDLAETNAIDNVLSAHYLAFNSTIQNCSRAFGFLCPKKWINLERMEDPQIRYCSKCKSNVRYCQNEDELNQAVSKNECVAFRAESEYFLRILPIE